MSLFFNRIRIESAVRKLLLLCLATNGYLLGFQFAGATCTVSECKEITDAGTRSVDGLTWSFKDQWSPSTATQYKMRSTSGLGGDPKQHTVETSTLKTCDVFTPQCADPWDAQTKYKGTSSNCRDVITTVRLFCMDPMTQEGVANSWNEYQDASH